MDEKTVKGLEGKKISIREMLDKKGIMLQYDLKTGNVEVPIDGKTLDCLKPKDDVLILYVEEYQNFF